MSLKYNIYQSIILLIFIYYNYKLYFESFKIIISLPMSVAVEIFKSMYHRISYHMNVAVKKKKKSSCESEILSELKLFFFFNKKKHLRPAIRRLSNHPSKLPASHRTNTPTAISTATRNHHSNQPPRITVLQPSTSQPHRH